MPYQTLMACWVRHGALGEIRQLALWVAPRESPHAPEANETVSSRRATPTSASAATPCFFIFLRRQWLSYIPLGWWRWRMQVGGKLLAELLARD